MKICWIFVLFCSALPALALSGGMEKAIVHSMRKVPCQESQETGRGGILSNLVGGGGSGIFNECIEYELRTDKVSYIIRPRRAVLLLLGGNVSIKLADSELLLRTGEAIKDIRCAVLSMTLRAEAEKREREREASGPPRCYSQSGREINCPYEP